MLFCAGISHSMCDESELWQRGWKLGSTDGSLEDLFSSHCPRQLPLVYHIDDWHLYDNDDSFDDDDADVNHTSITLLSYVQHDWTDDSFAAFVSTADLDLSENCEVDDSPGATREQGFYDITMLSGGVISQTQLSGSLGNADKDSIFIHPDWKLECIMATHHRQRRVAEQLLTSECLLQATAAASTADGDDGDDDKHGKLSREPSFVTGGCPQLSKVKPDDFWIRDVVDTLPSDSEEAKCTSPQCNCESASVCSCGGSLPPDSKLQQNSTSNSVQSFPVSPGSPGRKVMDIAQQLAQEECSVDKIAESEAKLARPLSIYETEGISIEPGLVRRTVDLEVDVSASPVKPAVSHSVSIYETEEISLEPGLVQRTRQEIEQRER